MWGLSWKRRMQSEYIPKPFACNFSLLCLCVGAMHQLFASLGTLQWIVLRVHGEPISSLLLFIF